MNRDTPLWTAFFWTDLSLQQHELLIVDGNWLMATMIGMLDVGHLLEVAWILVISLIPNRVASLDFGGHSTIDGD